jgi:dTDP-4-dehydrorhamnose 3,5-epimerase
MKTYGTMLDGLEIVTHKKYNDHRGSFCETWKNIEKPWKVADGMRGILRQLNTAVSVKNVIRGLHRQNQYKRVMPVVGNIFDVAVNVDTGEWFGIELDDNTGLLIPPEYAHGYLVLSDLAVVQYIVDMPYNKTLEENYRYDQFNIEWPLTEKPILSEKDS